MDAVLGRASRRAGEERPDWLVLPPGWVLVLLAGGAAVVAALLWSSSRLESTAALVIRDTRSMVTISQLESALLSYQRTSNLARVSEDPALDASKARIVTDVEALMRDAERDVGSDAEARLLQAVREDIAEYVALRARVDANEAYDIAAVLQQTRPSVDQALNTLRALERVNTAQALRAENEARRLDRMADLASAIAIAAVLLGIIALFIGVRLYIVRPLVQLHGSIQRFRRGDLHARTRERGWRVVREVSRAFNEMARSQARQRDEQLAFLAGVAHDLRNPLATVKMGIEVVAGEATDRGRREWALGVIERQVDRLSRMIEDLLAATRIEAGELELQRSPFDVRDAVRDVAQQIAATVPGHRIILRLDERPIMVSADQARIEQVVANLLSNAVKYSPQSGRVVVSATTRGSEWALLEVSDQGIGMTPEHMNQLFVPFRRAATTVAPGAGLGLSVVRRIVNSHGGKMEVESSPQQGSTFRVLLPRLPQPQATVDASHGRAQPAA